LRADAGEPAELGETEAADYEGADLEGADIEGLAEVGDDALEAAPAGAEAEGDDAE
jgi:hypothetical protein